MVKKTVIKLNKELRKEIVANFINDRISKELSAIQNNLDSLGKNLLSKLYSKYNKEELELFNKECNKIKISTIVNSEYNKGVIANKFKNKHNILNFPVSIYELNYLSVKYNEDLDIVHLCNNKLDNNNISFSSLYEYNATKEIYSLDNEIKNIESEVSRLSFNCYDLLKKVRTVDNLLSQWSEAYRFLPKNMKIEEPLTLSLSEKFALL